MFKPGDFVVHCRQGPGRIVEVLPDHVVVRPRNGNLYRVNGAIAEHELVPAPSDGFIALLAQRDYSSESLLEHIPEIVQRVMRDKHHRSISKKELKAEFAPFLAREKKPFANWWKLAQKKILESGEIIPDPKRKRTHLTLSAELPEARVSVDAAARANSPSEVLHLAREISSTEDVGAGKAASLALSQRILALFLAQIVTERSDVELLLATLYIVDMLEDQARAKLLGLINRKDVRQIPIARDLDDDLVVALSRLAKTAAGKAVELALCLLDYPSETVAKKAFSILNTDKNRHRLKTRFFDWLNAPDRTLEHLPLYLHDDFLAALRREDKGRLYRVLSQRQLDNEAVRKLLSRTDFASLAAEGVDSKESLAMLSSRQLTPDARGALIRSLGPEDQAKEILQRFVPDLDASLALCIRQLDWTAFSRNWHDLIEVVQRPGAVQTPVELSSKCKAALDADSGTKLIQAIAFGCALIEVVDDGELRAGLERAIGNGTKRLVGDVAPHVGVGPVVSAVKELIDDSKSELKTLAERSAAGAQAANERAHAAEQESLRLRNIVDMIKAASGQEKHEVRSQGKREIINALLPFMDELERRSGQSPDDSASNWFSDFKAALVRAGLEQIGAAGALLPFDPHAHEFVTEPGKVVESVKVIRTGYILRDNGSEVVIRRALVKPVDEVP